MKSVDLVLKNGIIVTPAGRIDAGIAVENGKVVLIAKESHLPCADSVIDAKRRLILPGFIDAHVHFRDPGQDSRVREREDFGSGTEAAAAGGITTVIDMPGSRGSIPIISAAAVREKVEAIKSKAFVDFGLYGGAGGENLRDIDALGRSGVVAFKTFMTEGRPYSASDDLSLFKVLERTGRTGLLCSVHAEDSTIINYLRERISSAGMNGPMAHLESRPNFTEEVAISKALILARVSGSKIHIAHMSTHEGVMLVRSARSSGQKVTAETCPHYLVLTREMMKQKGPYAKVDPPLRSAYDVEELWSALRSGDIDIIVSDHAPYTKADKDPGFSDIWKVGSGMPGVETTIPLMLTTVNKGKISLETLVRAMSESVSRIFGLYPRKGTIRVGSDADFTVVDLEKETTLRTENLHTKARDSVVYDGWRIKGIPVGTVVRGVLVMWEGQILGKPGKGEFLTPVV